MTAVIFMIIGVFIGSFVGVALMCLLQINKSNHYERMNGTNEKKEHSEDSSL